jgi:predicted peroxiredoxin
VAEKLLFQCTHGKDDPERAILPFVAANVAAIAGQESIVILTIDAVWLGTKGGTDGIEKPGFPKLTELYSEFIENGGQVWLCGTCANPRGITQDHLAEGARITGAARIIEEVINGARSIAFA